MKFQAGEKSSVKSLYSVKSGLRHRTKVEKLGSLRVKTIEKWILKMKQPKKQINMILVRERFFVLMLGNTEIKTACQQFHKCRYVRVISPDILKTP